MSRIVNGDGEVSDSEVRIRGEKIFHVSCSFMLNDLEVNFYISKGFSTAFCYIVGNCLFFSFKLILNVLNNSVSYDILLCQPTNPLLKLKQTFMIYQLIRFIQDLWCIIDILIDGWIRSILRPRENRVKNNHQNLQSHYQNLNS